MRQWSEPIGKNTAVSKNGLLVVPQPKTLLHKHDYQNQQITIYKGTLLVKMIA